MLRDLAAPAVFENRVTYRLTEAVLISGLISGLSAGLSSGLTPGASRLAFTRGRYFDGVDTGEAAAHEYAATRLGGRPAGLRALIADPCDLRRRPANLAISTLTLRLDRATGRASFLLHWRDPAKVGHAGGLYQVIPVGVFQPSGEAGWTCRPGHRPRRDQRARAGGRCGRPAAGVAAPRDAHQLTAARARGGLSGRGCMPRHLVGRYAASSHTCLADGETMVGTEYLNVGHHAVQFYGHDEDLAERVVGYLLEAFGNGGVAVVIATPEHRREFEARLTQALGGHADLAAAADSGAYLALDARETVRALMPASGSTPLRPIGSIPLPPAARSRCRRPARSRCRQLDPAAAGSTPLPSTA